MPNHIIICGSISVNDAKHDANPFNFINPCVRRAKALKSSVTMLFYPAGYERRVYSQKKEHDSVDNPKKDKNYFFKVMERASIDHKFSLAKIWSKDELTAKLQAMVKITTIDYFGHSNDKAMFLEYASIEAEKSRDFWQAADGVNVKPSQFEKGAVFASYGCNQGDPAGLCMALRKQWRIDTIGSYGKTDYEITGPFGGPTYPTSMNTYVKFPAPAVDKAGDVVIPMPRPLFLKYSKDQPPS